MADELDQIMETTETMDAQSMVNYINELKQNTVSKSDYEKVCRDRDTYFKACVDAKPISAEVEISRPSMQELRNDLYGVNHAQHTDIEYMTKTLELRDRVLEETGVDPLETDGESIAEPLRELIDSCNGSNDVFVARFHALKKK